MSTFSRRPNFPLRSFVEVKFSPFIFLAHTQQLAQQLYSVRGYKALSRGVPFPIDSVTSLPEVLSHGRWAVCGLSRLFLVKRPLNNPPRLKQLTFPSSQGSRNVFFFSFFSVTSRSLHYSFETVTHSPRQPRR